VKQLAFNEKQSFQLLRPSVTGEALNDWLLVPPLLPTPPTPILYVCPYKSLYHALVYIPVGVLICKPLMYAYATQHEGK
jgi:hypothetical protein